METVIDGLPEDITAQKTGGAERREPAAVVPRLGLLSRGEREVMNLVVRGKTDKVNAGTLDIGMTTVKMRRAKVMQKLQVAGVAELVRVVLLSERRPRSF